MGEKTRKLFATAILLPVILVLFFDPAARTAKWNLFSDIFGTILFIDVPVAMCMWHCIKPEHFHGVRLFIPFGLMSILSWTAVAGMTWLSYKIGRFPANGFSGMCAFAFGWAYIWLTMIPIGTVYIIWRIALKLLRFRKKTELPEKIKEP